jgi:hypothetical protein
MTIRRIRVFYRRFGDGLATRHKLQNALVFFIWRRRDGSRNVRPLQIIPHGNTLSVTVLPIAFIATV